LLSSTFLKKRGRGVVSSFPILLTNHMRHYFWITIRRNHVNIINLPVIKELLYLRLTSDVLSVMNVSSIVNSETTTHLLFKKVEESISKLRKKNPVSSTSLQNTLKNKNITSQYS
jgi:hypothetical protein